jgi:hypothetical protein
MLKQFHCFYVHYSTVFRVCGSDVGLALDVCVYGGPHPCHNYVNFLHHRSFGCDVS